MTAPIEVPHDVRQAGPDAVTRYRRLIRSGQSPSMSEMMALKQPTGTLDTDRAFFASNETIANELTPGQYKILLRRARKLGITVNPHSILDHGLADSPLDPKALIGPSEGRAKRDAMLSAQQIGHQSGYLKKGVGYRPGPSERTGKRLAPDLIKRQARKLIQRNPDLARLSKRELHEKIVAEHGSDGKLSGPISRHELQEIHAGVKG